MSGIENLFSELAELKIAALHHCGMICGFFLIFKCFHFKCARSRQNNPLLRLNLSKKYLDILSSK
jgi:hypothetical protein